MNSPTARNTNAPISKRSLIIVVGVLGGLVLLAIILLPLAAHFGWPGFSKGGDPPTPPRTRVRHDTSEIARLPEVQAQVFESASGAYEVVVTFLALDVADAGTRYLRLEVEDKDGLRIHGPVDFGCTGETVQHVYFSTQVTDARPHWVVVKVIKDGTEVAANHTLVLAAPLTLGTPCVVDAECVSSAYCSSQGICTPRPSTDDICTASSQCELGLVCVRGDPRTCQPEGPGAGISGTMSAGHLFPNEVRTVAVDLRKLEGPADMLGVVESNRGGVAVTPAVDGDVGTLTWQVAMQAEPVNMAGTTRHLVKGTTTRTVGTSASCHRLANDELGLGVGTVWFPPDDETDMPVDLADRAGALGLDMFVTVPMPHVDGGGRWPGFLTVVEGGVHLWIADDAQGTCWKDQPAPIVLTTDTVVTMTAVEADEQLTVAMEMFVKNETVHQLQCWVRTSADPNGKFVTDNAVRSTACTRLQGVQLTTGTVAASLVAQHRTTGIQLSSVDASHAEGCALVRMKADGALLVAPRMHQPPFLVVAELDRDGEFHLVLSKAADVTGVTWSVPIRIALDVLDTTAGSMRVEGANALPDGRMYVLLSSRDADGNIMALDMHYALDATGSAWSAGEAVWRTTLGAPLSFLAVEPSLEPGVMTMVLAEVGSALATTLTLDWSQPTRLHWFALA